MISTAYSDIGKKRAANEDSYFISEFINDAGYIIVADGMGGHKGGATASRMTVDCIKEYLQKNLSFENNVEIRKLLKESIESANTAVFESAAQDSNLFGMGTTVVLCLVDKNCIYIANVGDSRLYHIFGDTINQVTKDHSVVQELIDLGEISENEAANHPSKNLITRAVGTSKEIQIDYYKFCAKSDDVVLICTDGLSNMIKKDEIKNIVTKESNLQTAVKSLVDEANFRGGFDNITVAALRF